MKKRVLCTAENPEYLPSYATAQSAGADLRACLKEPKQIEPGASLLIPTGLKMEIPEGYEIQIRPRSGLAFKHQITVLNAPGTIDADYRGELCVLLINHGKQSFLVESGMRIAQMVLAPVVQVEFMHQDAPLTATARGEGGFGHTGSH